MTVTIPKTEYSGEINAQPSKSAAHRALICAAMSEGEESIIHGIAESEDIKATIECLRELGAEITLHGDIAKIRGIDPAKRKNPVTLDCGESGSTLRFLLPICLLSAQEVTFVGSKRLFERPLDVYEKIASEQGIEFERTDAGIRVKGNLDGGFFRVAGDISNQFVTGLMFAMSFFDNGGIIEITPPIASASYIRMTSEMMDNFGVNSCLTEKNTVIINGKQRYRGREITVEGDWSSGAVFLGLEALGHDVAVNGLDTESAQGDKIIRRYLAKLWRGRPTLDVTDCPDIAPILMVTASVLNGAELIGTDRLKDKECDRGEAMAQELAKFGVTVLIGKDSIIVEKPEKLLKPEMPVSSHNDHRTAMSLAALMTLTGGEIEDAEAVKKSYPTFFDDLFSLVH